MKIAAAPSPRGTNNERLFLFHCPRGSTPELARPHHGGGGPASYCRRSRPDANIENDVVTPYAGLIDESAARRSFYFCCVPVTVETFSDFRSRRSIGVSGALQPFCASYRIRGKTADHTFPNPFPVLASRNEPDAKDSPWQERSMLMFRERPPAIRTLRGWAISVLNTAGAIRECEEHGWMQDRAHPHARDRAFDTARRDPPAGVSPEAAAVAIAEVLDSIGDTCPKCPPPD